MGEWVETKLGSVLRRVRRKIVVEAGVAYPAVSVTMYGNGLGPKEPFVGGVTGYETLFQVRTGDVVLRTITAFESPVAVATGVHDGTHVSQVFITYEVLPEAMPEYLALVFRSSLFWDQMQNRATGTVLRRKTISDAAFRGIPVALPPLREQRHIVAVMAAVDAVIEALETEASTLANLRAQLVESAVVASEGSCTIGDLAEVSQGKSLPKAVQGQQTGIVPWFKIADMAARPNLFGYVAAETRLSSTEIGRLGGRVVPRCSVVFPRVGAAVLTEKKRILDVDGAVDENHLVLTAKSVTDPEFLLGLMERFRLASLVQTGAVPSLNMSLVRGAEVPAVDIRVQRSVGAALQKHRLVARAASEECAALQRLRTDLLSALLSRDIAVNEALDRFIEGAA